MTDLNLKPQDLDRLGQALLTLAKELWIVKDRVRVLEAALADANIIVADTVDRYEPGPELAAELELERARLIEELLDTLAPGKQ
jgi:hypothetical protein